MAGGGPARGNPFGCSFLTGGERGPRAPAGGGGLPGGRTRGGAENLFGRESLRSGFGPPHGARGLGRPGARNRKIAACPSPTAYLRCWRYTIRAESAGRQRTTASGTKPFRGRSRSTARSKIVSSFPAKASGYPPARAQTECVKAKDRLLARKVAGRTWSRDH